MKLGIRLHLAGLSLSNTVVEVEQFGIQQSRKAVHDWVHKADLQSVEGASPDHVALDETVIRINGQQYRLYAAVDPDTNRILHRRLFSTTMTALTERVLRELQQKHNVEDAVFLVDHAAIAVALHRARLRFQPVSHGNQNSVKHVFRGVKQRTSSFINSFSHIDLKNN